METTKPTARFHIGQTVTARAFVDCFKKSHPAQPGLTVIEMRLIEPGSIPSYYRVKAIGPNGFGYVEGAEHFFEV
jgi:hypothetical protein